MTKENENKEAVQAAENEDAQENTAVKAAKEPGASAKKSAPKKNQKKEKTGFWKGVRQEMSRVVWPTKKELGEYTVVTILFCAVFAVGFWLIDTGFLAFLKAMFGVTLSQ